MKHQPSDLDQLLINAARNGDPAEVLRLLSLGANPEKFPGQIGALGAAASSYGFGPDSVECLKILIPLCDPNAADPEDGWTALMFAANGINPAKVELLAPHSDCSRRNSDGETALMIAAGVASPQMVAALLAQPGAKQAARNCRDSDGRDALMIASQAVVPPGRRRSVLGQSAEECIPLLLPVADLFAVDSSGFTALGAFLRMGVLSSEAVAKALCERIDPRQPCEPSGLSALNYAKERVAFCPEEVLTCLERRCDMLNEIEALERSTSTAPSTPKAMRI